MQSAPEYARHANACHRISGSAFSVNVVVKQDTFKWTGSPKEYEKKSDAGRSITNHFCPDCGSTLARSGGAFPGMYIVKAGVLDDIEYAKPVAELYSDARPAWIHEIEGAEQLTGMGGN